MFGKRNPLPKDVSIEKAYNTVKLPILRLYKATQPKPALSEESDDDPGCDGFVSEADLVPADERSTLEFTVDRNDLLDLTEEPRLPSREESITEFV